MPCSPHPMRALGASLLQDWGLWLPRLQRANHVQRVLEGGAAWPALQDQSPLPLWGLLFVCSGKFSQRPDLMVHHQKLPPLGLVGQVWVLCEVTGLEHRLFPLFQPSSGLPPAPPSPLFPTLSATPPACPPRTPAGAKALNLMLVSVPLSQLLLLGAPRAPGPSER